jgi:hypothetical protein
VSVFEELERFVPAARLDEWRRWIAYSKKYEPTDEIGHICQAAGWLALLTSETPARLAERNNEFLEAMSAKLDAEQEQRNDLQKAIANLTEVLQHQDGRAPKSGGATQLPKPVVDLEPAASRIVQAADTLTRLNADRIKYGLLLAWGFGLLSYPVLHFFWHAFRQIAHF